MLTISKGTARVSIALNAGIVPTLHALSGCVVPRETIAAYVVAEASRSDFSGLDRLVKSYRTIARAEKALEHGRFTHLAYSEAALEGLRDAYRAALKRYAELNPLCVTVEYDGSYVDGYTVEYLTQVLVKNIACGKLKLNDRF